MITVGKLSISTELKIKLIKFIELHQNIKLDGDLFEKSIANVASSTINNLNESEWVGKTIGKYKIDRVINSGATGVVFLGKRDDDFSQNVAIKLINPSVTEMIGEDNVLNEARLMASLNHVGIAKIYDSGRIDGGIIYFIIEYVEGKPLTEVIKEKMTFNQVIDISIKLCSAISHAHENQIIHKDIKPDNILIDKHGEVKIIDFGLSQNNKLKSDTDTGFFAFSRQYASPEQLNQQILTSKTDIFSIGVVIFEMFTGVKYFYDDKSDQGIINGRFNHGALKNYLKHNILFNKNITMHWSRIFSNNLFIKELSSIIEMSIADNPKTRFKTIDALGHDIKRLSLNHPVKAYKPKVLALYNIRKFSTRNPIIVLMAMTLFTSFIWFSIETQRQLSDLVQEQADVIQVVGKFKEILVYAVPRERLGSEYALVDVLSSELHDIETSDNKDMSSHVKFELLMTIGEGLLSHGKGLDAEKAFKLAITIGTSTYGAEDIKVVTATVNLLQAYTQSIYFDHAIKLIEPYIDKVLTLEFEHVEYAKMFLVFNKVNSRFFVDKYEDIKKEDTLTTLRKISAKYRDKLSPIEIIDIDLSIIKTIFYDYHGDYGSPTAHINEAEVNKRIVHFKRLIPKLNKLVMIARVNKNRAFLLPQLLIWKARLSYEVKDYQSLNVAYSEGVSLAELYFDETDHRLSNAYLIGATLYRYIDTKKALGFATKSFGMTHASLNRDPSEYLDNMTIYLEFLYMNGDFHKASTEMDKALNIISNIGRDNITKSNALSISAILDVYYLYSHLLTASIDGTFFQSFSDSSYFCSETSGTTAPECDLYRYLNGSDINAEIATNKIKLVLNTDPLTRKKDHEVVLLAMIVLQNKGKYKLSSELISLFKTTINWSDLEKSQSIEYLSYENMIGYSFLYIGKYTEAKKHYLAAELILQKHYREDSAYVAIIYTGLAEIAYLENRFKKSQVYLDKTVTSFHMNFDPSSPLARRKDKLSFNLKNSEIVSKTLPDIKMDIK